MKHRKLAIIDLGSNSIRLVIYRIETSGRYKEILNVKKTARLSSHMDEDQNITVQGIHIIIQVLSHFQAVLDYHQVDEVLGVATAAVRQATNQADVLQCIEAKTNLTFRVLSEEEEAWYGYVAVVNSTTLEEGITIDIGGGSTEVTLFTERQLRYAHSFPFGAITLTREFIRGEQPTREEMEQLTGFLLNQFSSLPWLAKQAYPVVGIGGSSRNLALLHQRKTKYPLAGIHQYIIKPRDIDNLTTYLSQLTLSERQKLDELSQDRADIIIPALHTIFVLTQVTKAPTFMVSSKGLRDGLFYEKILDNPETSLISNVLEESLFQLAQEFEINVAHADQISRICTQLFTGMVAADIYPLQEEDLRILQIGARLNYLGTYIGAEAKHEHTFYILTNRLIEGLSHQERVQVALIASFKSKSFLKRFLKPFQAWFTPAEVQKLALLGAMVKIAYCLEYTQRNIIHSVQVNREEDEDITIFVQHKTDSSFEQAYVLQQKKHLEKALCRHVSFQFENMSEE